MQMVLTLRNLQIIGMSPAFILQRMMRLSIMSVPPTDRLRRADGQLNAQKKRCSSRLAGNPVTDDAEGVDD